MSKTDQTIVSGLGSPRNYIKPNENAASTDSTWTTEKATAYKKASGIKTFTIHIQLQKSTFNVPRLYV